MCSSNPVDNQPEEWRIIAPKDDAFKRKAQPAQRPILFT
jgi:hypothetical protein